MLKALQKVQAKRAEQKRLEEYERDTTLFGSNFMLTVETMFQLDRQRIGDLLSPSDTFAHTVNNLDQFHKNFLN